SAAPAPVVSVALGPLVGLLAALVGGLCVVVIALLVLLRRKVHPEGTVIRVELVNGQLVGIPMPGYTAPPAPPAPPALPVPAAAPAPRPALKVGPIPDTAQPFDIGPNYEAARALRAETVHQREQALLQHILEENQELRRRIEEELAREGITLPPEGTGP